MQKHHFTVDVEEYFQVSAFEAAVPRSRWNQFPLRARRATERLLELLDVHEARGTFFVLGWLAEREPELVRVIAEAGHEVASHGWGHRRVTTLSPPEFRDSVRRSRRLLEDLSGRRVHGYRAPSFSITRAHDWALDVLIEEGYTYDSSLFPIRRNGYGYVGGRRDPHVLERPPGRLVEVPPTTLRLGPLQLPAAGGAYYRLLPYSLSRAALSQAEARGTPGVFYVHPWEIDPGQPRLSRSPLLRVRHYGRLGSMEQRLRRLLSEFRFGPVMETVTTLMHAGGAGAR